MGGTFTIAKTIAKMLLKGPATIRYPAEPAKITDKTRGHISIKIEDCIFCGLCQKHCPSQAIEVSKPDRTWQIDRLRCIVCNDCVAACPKKCIFTETQYHEAVTGPVTDIFTGPEPKAEPKTDTVTEEKNEN